MVRLVIAGLLVLSSAASAQDFTCTDSGTRKRFAVQYEEPPNPLPCSVAILEYPLGTYHQRWTQPWRAVWQEGFCAEKVLELVDRHQNEGWKCIETSIWQGRERP